MEGPRDEYAGAKPVWAAKITGILAERRLRMAGHIIRMPPGRPANHAMDPSW